MLNLGQALWSTDGLNNTHYYSDEWKTLVDEFNLASDPDEQKEYASKMNDIFLEDIWITFPTPKPPRALMTNNVRGVYNFYVREAFELADAWISA